MVSRGVEARPRTRPGEAECGREPEELFGSAAEELDEQQVVERVLGVLRSAHQPQQPVGKVFPV